MPNRPVDRPRRVRSDRPAVEASGSPGPSLRRTALGLALAALLPRLVLYILQPELTYDGAYYLRQAQRLAAGRYEWIGFPPGYPAATAALHLLIRDWVVAGRLVSLAAGVATVPLVYLLARRWIAPAAALGVALFLVVHPVLAMTHVQTMSESLYLFGIVAALLAFETRRDLTCGLLLGGAFLVRPEAVAILLGLSAWRFASTRRPPWRLLAGLLPVLAFAVVASRTVGHPVLSPKQMQADLGAGVLPRAWVVIRTLNVTLPLPLVALAAVVGVRRRRVLLVTLVYLLTLPWLAVHVQERLHLPALPFLAILAAEGLLALRPVWRTRALAAAGLWFVGFAAQGFALCVRPQVLTPGARHIGTALRPALRFEDRVAGRFPLAAFYGGAGFVRAPREVGLGALMDSIATAGATHLLVLEGEMEHVLPQLRPLFDDAPFVMAESRLEVAARVEAPPGQRAILYRLRPPPVAPASTRELDVGLRAAVWAGPRLLGLTTNGRLRVISGPALAVAALPGDLDAIAVSADGSRLAAVRHVGPDAWLTEIEVATAAWRDWRATTADRPLAPAWLEHRILYVRGGDRGGLGSIDPTSGRRFEVGLRGMEDRPATPTALAVQGRHVALAMVPADDPHPERRYVVRARAVDGAGGMLELQVEAGTVLRLFDDGLAWIPGSDLLLASVQVGGDGPEGGAAPAITSSLCALRPDGALRRLTYGLHDARLPALRQRQLVCIVGRDRLVGADVAPDRLEFPAPAVFPADGR